MSHQHCKLWLGLTKKIELLHISQEYVIIQSFAGMENIVN